MSRLARLHGIQASYVDAYGRRRRPSRRTILELATALGAPVAGPGDVADAIRVREEARWTRPIEPVVVARGGRLWPVRVRVRASAPLAGREVRWHLEPEEGGEIDVTAAFAAASRTATVLHRARVSGRDMVEVDLLPTLDVPLGYHRLRFEAGAAGIKGSATGGATVISAPPASGWGRARTWGVFLPLYALRSERSWGTGDLGDLAALAEWTAALGGAVVATLPLLAAFLGQPYESSPYSPASRLLWNELYLEVGAVPELQRSAEARSILGSRTLQRDIARLRDASLVDYRRAAAVKRQVVEALARAFFADGAPDRRAAFARFHRHNRRVADYADFKAAGERHRAPWPDWPSRERDGHLPAGGGNPEAARYHRYAQWLMAQQMAATAERAREAGSGLYFDLPVGVNAAGYDVWRHRDVFAREASAGAPPDPFFAGGQVWGFPPLHPDRIREQGYGYFAESLRHSLRHASVLRIDHVMSLHRLYWVPGGADAEHGAYVRYRPEEFSAVLALESLRAGATIVGEDLGTVPPSVRWAMDRHGILRSYVMQMALRADPQRAIRPPPRGSVAAVNNHDMPPFAAFWRDADGPTRRAVVAFLRARGLLPREGDPSDRDVLGACLRHLARSDAGIVLVGLEDLWLETRPQNVPGTVEPQPNWRGRARHGFESFRRMPAVVGTLEEIDRARRGGTGQP